MKDLSDNEKTWRTVKPYFSNNGLNSNKLLLKEEGHLISDERTSKFNELFFINITTELDIKKETETFLGKR